MSGELDSFIASVQEENEQAKTYVALYQLFEGLFPKGNARQIRGIVPYRHGDGLHEVSITLEKIHSPYGPAINFEAGSKITRKNTRTMHTKQIIDPDHVGSTGIDEILEDEILMEAFHQLLRHPTIREAFKRIPDEGAS